MNGRALEPIPVRIESRLADIWAEVLGVERVGAEDNFFDLGGDTELAERLVLGIQQALGKELPASVLAARPTIRHLAPLLGEGSRRAESKVTAFHSDGHKHPFFFLHGDFLMSHGLYCLELARYMPDDQPFYILPPYYDEIAQVQTLEALAAEYVRQVRAVRREGPYRLGGFCNGGIMALEVARQLQRQGEEVDLVIVLDSSPNNVYLGPVRDAIALLGKVAGLGSERQRDILLWLRKWIRKARTGVLTFLRRLRHPRPLIAGLFARSDEPAGGASSWRTRLIDVPRYRRYRKMLNAYVPRDYRATLCLLLSEDFVKRRDFPRGWRRVAARVEVYPVTGNHRTCRTAHVKELAETLTRCIESADSLK